MELIYPNLFINSIYRHLDCVQSCPVINSIAIIFSLICHMQEYIYGVCIVVELLGHRVCTC